MKRTAGVLLSVSLGLIAGWICGDEARRRKNAELEYPLGRPPLPERQLKEIRWVVNDTHKHILAVSKALKNPAR
jgi:hypothetical protein